MKRLFGSVLDVRRGEVALTSLMCANYYLILVTYYFLKPARDSLFLVKVSPEQLPLVFILTALVTAPVVTLYAKASRTLPLGKLINYTTVVLILNLVGLRYLIQINESWVYYLFYTWVSIYGALTTSQFWLLANSMFDANQAKRIFVLLGTAGILGAFTGGEVTGLVVKNLGVATEDLLFFCMGLLVICTILVILIWNRREDQTSGLSRPKRNMGQPETKGGQSIKLILRSRHLTILVGIIAVTMMVASFVDFQFKSISAATFTDKADLTAFLGKFYGRLSLASLLLQLFFSYRLIRWLGVTGVILFLPISLVIGSTAMFLAPGLLAVILLRGSDGAFKYSLDKTGRELLFLPVPFEIKKRTKIFIDMFVDRWFRGLAGGLLLLCTLVLDLSVKQISLVVLALMAIWLTLTFLMRKEYVNSFRQALERREIDLDDLRTPIHDSETINSLIISLGSSNERQIVYGLEMLKSVKDVELAWPAQPLLQHQSALVRKKALQLLQLNDNGRLSDEIKKLRVDPDIGVRREAIKFACQERESEGAESIQLLLAHQDERVKLGALAYLAEYGNTQELSLVDQALVDSLMESEQPEAEQRRIYLARLLGKSDAVRFEATLDQLLNDDSPEVVNEAMASVGLLRSRKYVPRLVEWLGDRRFRAGSVTALSSFGSGVLGTLADYLNDPNSSLVVRKNILRVLARIPSQLSVEILSRSLRTTDFALRLMTMKALNKLRSQPAELKFDAAPVRREMVEETQRYYQIVEMLQLHGPATDDSVTADRVTDDSATSNPATKLLVKALIERQRSNLERIFRLLGLVYPPRDLYNAYYSIVSGQRQLHANAVEFLDNILPGDIKKYILPIVEDLPVDIVLKRSRDLFDLPRSSKEESLADLITGHDSWLRCCALHCCLSCPSERLRNLVDKARYDADPMVAETARLAAARWETINPSAVTAIVTGENKQMLTTVEKVIVLQNVDVFSEVPTEMLAELGAIAEEVTHLKGDVIYRENEYSDALYLTLDGEIQLHREDHRITTIKGGEAFGTWALFNEEVRLVTATVESDARLLRIDREDFVDLLADHVQIAQGMLTAVAKRLRKLVDRVDPGTTKD